MEQERVVDASDGLHEGSGGALRRAGVRREADAAAGELRGAGGVFRGSVRDDGDRRVAADGGSEGYATEQSAK